MADVRSSSAKRSEPTPPPSFAGSDLASGLAADARRLALATAALTDLLRGCGDDTQVSAPGLLYLLEPIAAALELLLADAETARAHWGGVPH